MVSEKTSSLALPPHLWALLQQGLPAGGAFKDRRKRLVLFLTMRCALTVSEIVNLTLGSIQAHAGSPEEVAEWLEVRTIGNVGSDERLIVGSAKGTAITPMGLYGICQAHMARCLQGYDIAQMGPNTLRNTCITLRLNQGVALPAILRRCGLKDEELLTRLQRHLLPAEAL